jgi:hypothetical protein
VIQAHQQSSLEIFNRFNGDFLLDDHSSAITKSLGWRKRLHNFPPDKALGVGTVDVQNYRVENPEEGGQTIQCVTAFIDPEHLVGEPQLWTRSPPTQCGLLSHRCKRQEESGSPLKKVSLLASTKPPLRW